MKLLTTTIETNALPQQGLASPSSHSYTSDGPTRLSSDRSPEPVEFGSRKTYEQLRRAVRKACPPWLGNRADDLAQKAALRVLERFRRKGERSMICSSYLHRVAYSVVIDEIRALRRRKHLQMAIPAEEGSQHAAAAPANDPERRADRCKIGSQILGCLEQMSPDRRTALTLNLQGYTVPESAALLGWNSKRTENLTCRARADLRRWLTAKGITP